MTDQQGMIDKIMEEIENNELRGSELCHRSIVREILESHLNHTTPCTACYGKKGYSVFHQDNSKDDFTGKDVGKGKSWTTIETCPRCKGTGEEPQVEASKQDKIEKLNLENGVEYDIKDFLGLISLKLNEVIDRINN